jgi:hypothetical protein
MLSERKHAVQIGNMSVRNMLSIVKKIGTRKVFVVFSGCDEIENQTKTQ